MAKKFTCEELDHQIHKRGGLSHNIGFGRRRSKVMITLIACFSIFLATLWGNLCFAEESLLNRTIIAKGSDTYTPYSFLNKEGKVSGFDNELFQAVAEAAGLKAKKRITADY